LRRIFESRLKIHTESFRLPVNAESAGRVAHAFLGGLNHAACLLHLARACRHPEVRADASCIVLSFSFAGEVTARAGTTARDA
jgi:hypothetical protein